MEKKTKPTMSGWNSENTICKREISV